MQHSIQAAQKVAPKKSNTLILFEEVDSIFESDAGMLPFLIAQPSLYNTI
jgi:hypothetical protein